MKDYFYIILFYKVGVVLFPVGVGYEAGDEEDLMLDVLSSDESLEGKSHIFCNANSSIYILQ